MTGSTVAQYLAALPPDRRAALSAVRKAINENLPDGYEEGMRFGMIGWYVPLSMYPAGLARIPECRCHLLRSHRRSRAWCCISCAFRTYLINRKWLREGLTGEGPGATKEHSQSVL
jgi:hypothetical protein